MANDDDRNVPIFDSEMATRGVTSAGNQMGNELADGFESYMRDEESEYDSKIANSQSNISLSGKTGVNSYRANNSTITGKPINNLNNNKRKNNQLNNGYNPRNNKYKNNQNNTPNVNGSELESRLKRAKEKQRQEAAKKAIVSGVTKYNPVAGAAVNEALKTKKGKKYLDAYAKADSPGNGVQNVLVEIKKEKFKRKAIIWLAILGGGIIVIFLLFAIIFKNADSQIYSNENNGTVESDLYVPDEDSNIFMKYPNLYEKVTRISEQVSNKYKIEIDKYLIISTLIAPIENGFIMPVADGSCGEPECYYFKGESKTWTQFIDSWSDQAELLAKMQMLTFTNNSGLANISSEETMEAFATNDKETNTFPWWGWLNPVNWFKGFTDAKDAETNARLTLAPNGLGSKIPDIQTYSVDRGEMYQSVNLDREITFEKDPNTGGVYFWNLINKNGFFHEYLKDYLSKEYADDPDKNYEINKGKIAEVTNYVYTYYDDIRKDCNGYKLIETTMKNIKLHNPPEKQSRFGIPEYIEVEFEQYVGGVILAECTSCGDPDGLRAFAILARSEALAKAGLDGSKTIENSSAVQNYNPTYSPEKYPKIAEAVKDTKGLVLSQYCSGKVWSTEYDAFCPQYVVLKDGFYILPEQQQSLPINPAVYEQVTGQQFINPDSEYLYCPCFRNNGTRPHDEIINRENIRYAPDWITEPSWTGGDPPQTTPSKSSEKPCWKPDGPTRERTDEITGEKITEYGWSYHVYGGHGRGASQYGIKYLNYMKYDRDAILRFFFKGAQIRRMSSSLEENECNDIPMFTGCQYSGSGTGSGNSNYTETIGGTPLNKSLTEALAAQGHTVDELNDCIGDRATSAGMGTRDAVVEAGMGLIQCTMDMTNGFTYPYDHRGGYIGGNYNPEIQGKLGVNPRWGEYADYATGCPEGKPCRLGLNCANFVRWAMCNGGMDLCSRGSTFATGMAGVNSSEDYFPGAIRVKLSPGFAVLSGSFSGSKEDAFDAIQPGDVLYSDHGGSGNHVMLIVGKSGDSITIAENGRKTRSISKSELLNGSMTYVVLLLDDYYANDANKNGLSW